MPGHENEPLSRIGTGVTLIEVLIILSCAGVLLTVAVPNFNHLQQQWTLWGGAHLLESSLQWGRAHAVSANTSMMLTVEEGGRRFYWSDGYSGERLDGTIRDLPGHVRITSSPRRPLRFYQHGNAAPAGTYVVQSEAGSYHVVVSPGGRIRVQRD